MTQLSVSEARAALPEVLDRVAEGEEITITRHGKPAAVVVRPDALRTRRAERTLQDARRIRELLDGARQQPLGDGPGLPVERSEELVRAVQTGRDRC